MSSHRLSTSCQDGATKVRVIADVPAGVCDQCSEQYLLAETVEAIERLLASPPERHETVLVWEYAPGA